jgi:hypothetical protein
MRNTAMAEGVTSACSQAQKSRRSGSGCGGFSVLSLNVTSKVKIMMLARG